MSSAARSSLVNIVKIRTGRCFATRAVCVIRNPPARAESGTARARPASLCYKFSCGPICVLLALIAAAFSGGRWCSAKRLARNSSVRQGEGPEHRHSIRERGKIVLKVTRMLFIVTAVALLADCTPPVPPAPPPPAPPPVGTSQPPPPPQPPGFYEEQAEAHEHRVMVRHRRVRHRVRHHRVIKQEVAPAQPPITSPGAPGVPAARPGAH